MTFIYILLVGVGGFFGAIVRFAISESINRIPVMKFPVATLVVNLVGSFLLGILIGSHFNDLFMLFFSTGFLGSFTTFSTFALESVQLYIEKQRVVALLYQVLSYGGGIVFALLGIVIARLI